jgi:hypothetical protein
VPVQPEKLTFSRKTATRFEHRGDLRTEHVPDFRPHLPEGLTQRPGVALSKCGSISVIIEKAQVRAPMDSADDRRIEADEQRRPQRLRPVIERSQRRC